MATPRSLTSLTACKLFTTSSSWRKSFLSFQANRSVSKNLAKMSKHSKKDSEILVFAISIISSKAEDRYREQQLHLKSQNFRIIFGRIRWHCLKINTARPLDKPIHVSKTPFVLTSGTWYLQEKYSRFLPRNYSNFMQASFRPLMFDGLVPLHIACIRPKR